LQLVMQQDKARTALADARQELLNGLSTEDAEAALAAYNLATKPSQRAQALRHVAIACPPQTSALIRKNLQDADREVRMAAMHAAGWCRDPLLIADIRPLLAHPDEELRATAAAAISGILVDAVVAPVYEQLDGESLALHGRLLSSPDILGEVQAYSRVVEAWQQQDTPQARAVSGVLSALDPARLRKELALANGVELSERQPERNGTADRTAAYAEAKAKIEEYEEADSESKARLFRETARLNSEWVLPFLLEHADDPCLDIRSQAVAGLSRRAAVRLSASKLLQALRTAETRFDAAIALGRLGRAAGPELARMALDPQHAIATRFAAAYALLLSDTPEGILIARAFAEQSTVAERLKVSAEDVLQDLGALGPCAVWFTLETEGERLADAAKSLIKHRDPGLREGAEIWATRRGYRIRADLVVN
jgi:hypothetical protein